MILTPFQKKIIESILEKRITNVASFLKEFGDLEQQQYLGPGSYTAGGYGTFKKDAKIFIPKNDKGTIDRLKEFIVLWNNLEANGLILVIPEYPKAQPKIPIFTRDKKGLNNEISSLVRDYYGKEIVFIPDLENFVKREYLTKEEYYQKSESIDRNKALSLTRKIAYISIGVSLFIALLTALFNFWISTKDRDVTIKNPNAFSDTINVNIIEPLETSSTKIDTVIDSEN